MSAKTVAATILKMPNTLMIIGYLDLLAATINNTPKENLNTIAGTYKEGLSKLFSIKL